MRPSFLLIFCLALLSACASKRGHRAHPSTPAATAATTGAPNSQTPPGPIGGEVAMTEEPDAEEGDEENDGELVDGTPTDLGEVEASDKRREDEVRADILSQRTFPLVDNEFVQQWVRYFTGRGRSHFEKWLSRSPRYRPLISSVMKEEGLPDDLVYLAMIESGFNPKARSHAKAVGPWQFIKSTGQRYGLTVDSWVDERRDIQKSTHAAAKYLKELHQIFGSWYLAAASYNAGEGKVLNAVRRDRSRNFWELARKKKNFRPETRNYVPKIIAAALITKDPQKYGFQQVAYEEPLKWETIPVPAGTDLRAVNKVTGIELETLKLMNSELKRSATPPGKGMYPLHVPAGQTELVTASLDKIRALKYKPEAEEQPRSRRGRRGSRVAGNRPNFAPKADNSPVAAGSYRVQSGDTLWELAKKHNTTVAEIKRLNQIRKPRDLRPGKVIKVPN